MTDPSTTVEQSHEILPPVDRGMSITKATVIALSAGLTRFLAVISLLSLVAFAYGLIELALAVIATTAERRRMAREVTERRQGDRARRPTPH
jgi:heme exporter protein D